MKTIVIDLLDNDLAVIPDGLGEDVLVIRNYSVPQDYDLALEQAQRILDGIRKKPWTIPDEITIFIPETAYAFGMVLAISIPLMRIPRIFVQRDNEIVGLLDFTIQKEIDNGTQIQLRAPE